MAPELAANMTAKAAAAAAVKPATRAYVTFLAGDGDYWKGVVGLAKGLRKVGSAYPLVVAVLPDVPESHRHILVSQGCIVREIEPVYPPENQTKFGKDYFVINYSKLRIWEVMLLVAALQATFDSCIDSSSWMHMVVLVRVISCATIVRVMNHMV
jgi:inositol 3-alpha-galactosyltransferase